MDTYQETLDYLFNRLPVYQREGKAAYKPGIGNIIDLCDILDQPHQKFKSIHIAGTNGKGSTAHSLASIFQEAGYKVGLYTSPHLVDFRERVKINGKMISKEAVSQFVNQYKEQFESIDTSFFEWTVALAFDQFRTEHVDIAIIETGLGGRLDSTNILSPLLSVITNIGYDHVQFLGNTLDKIAFEKAGIIKNDTPVVIGEFHDETFPVFENKAKEMNATLYKAFELEDCNTRFDIFKLKTEIDGKPYQTDLIGAYHIHNLKTILKTIEVYQNIEGIQIPESSILKGLKNVKLNTSFKGRYDIILSDPITICDCAHNESGLKIIFDQANKLNKDKIHIVYGTVSDKDLNSIIPVLPADAKYYICQANVPRALDKDILYNKLPFINKCSYSSVNEAYKDALNQAEENDLIIITGSTFIVSDLYSYLNEI